MEVEVNETQSVKYNRISEVMGEQDFSTKHLAKLMGTYESTVASWRANSYQPHIDKFYIMADIMEVDVRSLFMPNEKMTPIAFWHIGQGSCNRQAYTRYNRIKEVKEEMKLTEKEFIKRTRTGKASVHRWLSNEVEPYVPSLYRIADGLGLDVRILLFSNRKARVEPFWLLPPVVKNTILPKG